MLKRRSIHALCFSVAILCFFSYLAAAQQTAPPKPISTTVTELAKKSTDYDGKLVRLRAAFESDGIEHSLLLEPDCNLENTSKQPPPIKPQCDLGIVPRIKDGVENRADIQAFDNALTQGGGSTTYKYIAATFTGRFFCRPSCGARRGRVLEIEQVDDLEVLMKDLRPHRPRSR